MQQIGSFDPLIEGAFSTTPYQLSDALLQRIVTAYRLAVAAATPSQSELWSSIGEKSAHIHAALMSDGASEQLRALLADPSKHHLFFGFDNIFKEEVETLLANAELRRQRMDQMHYILIQLAEAIGTARMYNAEFGASHSHVATRPTNGEQAIALIEGKLGPLHFPNAFPYEHGMPTAKGIVSHRAVFAVLEAWRVRALTTRFGPRVLEIGAGLGRSAFFAHQLGVTEYTIIDLPMTCVAQTLFLASALGEDGVTVMGEARRPGAVAVLPPSALEDQVCDVIVNLDSLTEMSLQEAAGYADYAARSGAAFLSINHEANDHTASSVLGAVMRQESRNVYWLRPGYVEEIFTPRPKRRLLQVRDALLRPRR